MAFSSLFPNQPPSGLVVAIGIALGLLVTVLLGIQAFGGDAAEDGLGYGGDSMLATTIFALHIATVVCVVGDATVFEGKVADFALLTIGSGAAATLAQTAVVARTAEDSDAEMWALLILVLQSFADGTMLAIIIADLRSARGPLGGSTEGLLSNAFV